MIDQSNSSRWKFTVESAAGLSASLTGPALVLIGLLQGAGCRLVLALKGLLVQICTSLRSALLQCDMLPISVKQSVAGCPQASLGRFHAALQFLSATNSSSSSRKGTCYKCDCNLLGSSAILSCTALALALR